MVILDALLVGNAIIYLVVVVTYIQFSMHLFRQVRAGANGFTRLMAMERLFLGLFYFGNLMIAVKNLSFLGLMDAADPWRLFTLLYQFAVSIVLLFVLWRWRHDDN